MAASSAQLLGFYRAVFRDDGARANRIREVGEILSSLDRWSPETRIGAKLARAVGLPEDELELSLEQLGCLQSAFVARPMSALAPAAEPLQSFYERLFFEDDSLLSLRRLQAAARDCHLFSGNASMEKEKWGALLQCLRQSAPGVDWTPAHLDALVRVLGRDVSFRSISPVDFPGDLW